MCGKTSAAFLIVDRPTPIAFRGGVDDYEASLRADGAALGISPHQAFEDELLAKNEQQLTGIARKIEGAARAARVKAFSGIIGRAAQIPLSAVPEP